MSLESIPAWLGTAVIGALIVVVGNAAKSLYEFWASVRKTRAARLASIIDLSTLFTVSRIIFFVQNQQARDLLALLQKNHPNEIKGNEGFEASFSKLHERFLPEEADLHNLIRGWTEYSLRPINEAILDWLKNDTLFRTAYVSAKDDKKRKLAEKLNQLHAHLLLWECKYNAWIPNNPKHALVYLADEESHGVGFPVGLDQLSQDVLSDLKKSAPTVPVVEEK